MEWPVEVRGSESRWVGVGCLVWWNGYDCCCCRVEGTVELKMP